MVKKKKTGRTTSRKEITEWKIKKNKKIKNR